MRLVPCFFAAALGVLLHVPAAHALPHPRGVADTSFGRLGARVTGLSHGDYEAPAAALDSRGRLVVATGRGGDGNVITRFRADGTVDRSFGRSGSLRIRGGVDTFFMRALPSGKLLLAGQYGPSFRGRMTIVRVGPAGIDRTFGTGGYVGTGLESDGAFHVDARGRITIAGAKTYEEGFAVTIRRLLADGSRDQSFGVAGEVVLPVTSGASPPPTRVLPMPDGGVLVAVRFTRSQTVLARVDSNGAPVPTFGQDGILRVPAAIDAVARPDGRFVLRDARSLRQHLATGAVDRSFGSNGVRLLDAGPKVQGQMLLQRDGKLLVPVTRPELVQLVGMDPHGYDSGFVRLTTKGAIDTRFGRRGMFLFRIPLNQDAAPRQSNAVLTSRGTVVSAFGSGRSGAGDPSALPWRGVLLTSMR